MAYPSFRDSSFANEYVWAFWPQPPSDRPDLDERIRLSKSTLDHTRNKVVYAATVMLNRGVWGFTWKNVTQAMITSLRAFYEMEYFKYYPDSAVNAYWHVYIPRDQGFTPRYKRGGRYDLAVEIHQYDTGLHSSSFSISGSMSMSYSTSASISESESTSTSASMSYSASASASQSESYSGSESNGSWSDSTIVSDSESQSQSGSGSESTSTSGSGSESDSYSGSGSASMSESGGE